MKGSFTKIKKFLFLWLPALIWAGIIFYLSHQSGLKAGLSTPNEILFRKVVHAVEFGVLAWLVWRLLQYGFEMETKRAVIWAAVISVLFAASDEIHQLFVVDRSGQPMDVVVDSLGVLAALLVVVPIYTRKLKFWMIAAFFGLATLFAVIVGNMISESMEIVRQRETELQEGLKRAQEETLLRQGFEGQAGNRKQEAQEDESKIENRKSEIEDEDSGTEDAQEQNTEVAIPLEGLLSVPFTSQAPFANWDHTHEEACEEASLIMVKYFLDGEKLTPTIAEKEIQDLKEYQLKKYGRFEDSDMEELVEIAEGFYGLQNLKVVYDFSKEDIKSELAKGNPVIVPSAGRELGNPFFTAPGPLYHNLVLVGYRGSTIITNDPGTRRGEKFEYNINVLFNAIHDFPGKKENILQGRKAMIVVRPEE